MIEQNQHVRTDHSHRSWPNSAAPFKNGESIELAFKFLVQPNDYEVKLVTPAQIQSGPKPKSGQGRDESLSHGVRFAKLRATEALLLQSYIQQVLLTDRSRVV